MRDARCTDPVAASVRSRRAIEDPEPREPPVLTAANVLEQASRASGEPRTTLPKEARPRRVPMASPVNGRVVALHPEVRPARFSEPIGFRLYVSPFAKKGDIFQSVQALRLLEPVRDQKLADPAHESTPHPAHGKRCNDRGGYEQAQHT